MYHYLVIFQYVPICIHNLWLILSKHLKFVLYTLGTTYVIVFHILFVPIKYRIQHFRRSLTSLHSLFNIPRAEELLDLRNKGSKSNVGARCVCISFQSSLICPHSLEELCATNFYGSVIVGPDLKSAVAQQTDFYLGIVRVFRHLSCSGRDTPCRVTAGMRTTTCVCNPYVVKHVQNVLIGQILV